MARVIRRAAARRDFVHCLAFLIETAGDAVALRFESATRETFQELLRMPQIGSPQYHPRFPGMRRWRVCGFEKYFIFYRPAGGNVEIIRIIHSSRDIDRVFLQ